MIKSSPSSQRDVATESLKLSVAVLYVVSQGTRG